MVKEWSIQPFFISYKNRLFKRTDIDYNDYKIKVQVNVFNGYFNDSQYKKNIDTPLHANHH